MNTPASHLNEIFVDACTELFQGDCHIGSIESASGFDVTNGSVACIDGGNEQFEVILTLNLPYSALNLTLPETGVLDIKEDELEDWNAELANRLLGKLNHQLELYGYYLKTGIPQSGFGIEFVHPPKDSATLFSHCFNIDGELIMASIQIEVYDDAAPFVRVQEEVGTNAGNIEFF